MSKEGVVSYRRPEIATLGEGLTKRQQEILDYWNSKEIVKHKPTLKFLKAALKKALEEYTAKEIKQGIDNYAEMYFSDYHYMNHAWKLPDFLRRPNALPDCLPQGSKWLNYLKWKERNEKPEPDVEPVFFINEGIYQQCLKWLRSLPYDEYLQTEHWQHFRGQALVFANYSCQLCGGKEDSLHVHHKSYENRGRETFLDVIVLCGSCHEMIHKNL